MKGGGWELAETEGTTQHKATSDMSYNSVLLRTTQWMPGSLIFPVFKRARPGRPSLPGEHARARAGRSWHTAGAPAKNSTKDGRPLTDGRLSACAPGLLFPTEREGYGQLRTEDW